MALLDNVKILIKTGDGSEWLVLNGRGVLDGHFKEFVVIRYKEEGYFGDWRKRNPE